MRRGRVLTAAGLRGRRCRQPEPWLRVHAPKPHEQGAWALRFGSDGAGKEADGGRPTSRGLPPAGRWATLPCPGGQGALPGMRGRRCLPCGQRRCRVARRIMACRGRERGFRSGLPIRELYRRAGERGNGPHPAGDGDTRHLADRTRPSPGKTFRIILPPQTRRSTRHVSCPSRKTSPARAQDQRSAPVYDLSAPVYGPFRAIYDLPTPLRSSHVFSGRSMPFAAPPRLYGFRAICGASPAPLRLSYACLWPFCAICDTFRVICGASSAFTTILRLLMAIPRHLRRIPRLSRLSHTFCGHSVPFTAFPCLFPCYSCL